MALRHLAFVVTAVSSLWACLAEDSTPYLGGSDWQSGDSTGWTSSSSPDASTSGSSPSPSSTPSPSPAPSPSPSPTPSSDASAPPADGASASPEALFDALLPTFESTCGPCHVQGTDNAPAYLGGSDPYTTIKTFAGVIVANPLTSILITKGAHQGPALVDPLRASILTWLTAESAGAPKGPASTAPFAVTIGANQLDLSSLVPGAAMTFTAATSGNDLNLSTIDFIAPASSTVTVTYPIFYIVPPTGSQIQDDDFSNVNQTIPAGQTATLGPGLLSIEGWAGGDDLRIAFKELVASGGPAGSDDAGDDQ